MRKKIVQFAIRLKLKRMVEETKDNDTCVQHAEYNSKANHAQLNLLKLSGASMSGADRNLMI